MTTDFGVGRGKVFPASKAWSLPDRSGCLVECRRVLCSGGVEVFAGSRRDSDFIGRDELRALVEPHGFELDDIRGLRWETPLGSGRCEVPTHSINMPVQL